MTILKRWVWLKFWGRTSARWPRPSFTRWCPCSSTNKNTFCVRRKNIKKKGKFKTLMNTFGVVLSQLLHAPILMNGHWSHSKTLSWKTCNLKDNNHKKNLNASGWGFDIPMEIWGKTWLQDCGGWSCFCFPHSSSQRRTFHFRSSQT